MSVPEDEIRPLPIFYDAISKAHWAVQLLNWLIIDLASYKADGVKITVRDAEQGNIYREIFMEALPMHNAGLIIGDIVRNLRGALDAAVSGIFRAHEVDDKNAYWPIVDHSVTLHNNVNGRITKHGFGKIAYFFDEVAKIGNDKNIDLCGLSKIDNVNKHRSISVVITIAVLPDPSFIIPKEIISHGNKTLLSPGQQRRYFIPADATLDTKFDSSPELSVKFGPSEAFPNMDVIATLSELSHIVLQAIKLLQLAYVKAYG